MNKAEMIKIIEDVVPEDHKEVFYALAKSSEALMIELERVNGELAAFQKREFAEIDIKGQWDLIDKERRDLDAKVNVHKVAAACEKEKTLLLKDILLTTILQKETCDDKFDKIMLSLNENLCFLRG